MEILKMFSLPGYSITLHTPITSLSTETHLVLLIDPGVVSEGEQPEPPSQIRRSDNGMQS